MNLMEEIQENSGLDINEAIGKLSKATDKKVKLALQQARIEQDLHNQVARAKHATRYEGKEDREYARKELVRIGKEIKKLTAAAEKGDEETVLSIISSRPFSKRTITDTEKDRKRKIRRENKSGSDKDNYNQTYYQIANLKDAQDTIRRVIKDAKTDEKKKEEIKKLMKTFSGESLSWIKKALKKPLPPEEPKKSFF